MSYCDIVRRAFNDNRDPSPCIMALAILELDQRLRDAERWIASGEPCSEPDDHRPEEA